MDFGKLRDILRPFLVHSSAQDEKIYFSDSKYTAIPFNDAHFHPIPKESPASSLAFIDGGQCELLKSSHFSLQCIRVCAVIYKNNIRTHFEREEFYVLISVKLDNGRLRYETTFFGNPLHLQESFLFELEDATLRQGIHKVPVSRIGEAVRRFAELKMAEKTAGELQNGDAVVLDGDLRSSMTHESMLFDALYRRAKEKCVAVSGFCKASTLLTDKGNSWNNFLRKKSKLAKWYYHPAAAIESPVHPAEMYFLKLNESSPYIFRFEACKHNASQVGIVISLLAENAADPVFQGYPYGLIEADQWARISRQEEISLKTQLQAYLGKDEILAEEARHDEDAHSVLDAIR